MNLKFLSLEEAKITQLLEDKWASWIDRWLTEWIIASNSRGRDKKKRQGEGTQKYCDCVKLFV
jgi:hypothetical protein